LGQPIAHRLSGGVDSAVVLASLVRAGVREIVCVNERPVGFPEGDEWEAAQQTARAQGVRLIAAEASPDRVDYSKLLDGEFHTKPSLADLSYAEPSLMATLAQQSGAIVTSGQGGDQIFLRGRAPYAGADALWDGAGPSAFMRIAADVARQARTHVWEVFGQALIFGLLRRRFDALAAQSFDTPLATEAGRARAIQYRQHHSWMEDAAKTSPARAMRVTRLIDLAFYAQPTCLAARYVTAPVLASRPVLESVLSIPPYIMIEGGVDRSLERAAFAEFIPVELVYRTRKGDATQYHTRALERNLPFVRELLLEGDLARDDLLDRDALKRALAGVWMTDGVVKANVMTCVLAEAWLQRLANARQRARAESAGQCGAPTG
jgi:asparagine synthase (glutamine-hydrolysing)